MQLSSESAGAGAAGRNKTRGASKRPAPEEAHIYAFLERRNNVSLYDMQQTPMNVYGMSLLYTSAIASVELLNQFLSKQ